MGEWGLHCILIFASHAELPYLSRLLTIPTRFSDYFLISHVLGGVLLPILHYFNFDGTDEHNLSQFMTGITGLIVFPSATWFLLNCVRICVFLYVLAFNVKAECRFSVIRLECPLTSTDRTFSGSPHTYESASQFGS